MSNLTNTAIEFKSQNSRAVSLNGSSSANKSCFIDRSGNLWAAFYDTNRNINVYYSTDNGFTWGTVSSINGWPREGEFQGNPLYFMQSEALERIYLVTDGGTIFELDATALERNQTPTIMLASIVEDYIGAPYYEYITGQDGYRDGLFTLCGDPDSTFYMFYSKSSGYTLKCAEYSMVNGTRAQFTYVELWSSDDTESTISSTEQLDCVKKDNACYVVFTDFDDDFRFVNYNSLAHTFGTPVTIVEGTSLPKDPCVAVDGQGSILAAFGDTNGAGTDINIKMGISLNDGTSWSTTTVTKPFNTTIFTDPVTDSLEVRLQLLGNVAGGFLMSAIFTNSSSKSTLYVKEISSIGAESDWKIVNTKDDNITGAQFFRPMEDRLPYFGTKENLRMAFQVGEGNDANGDDTVSTSIYQEPLTSRAYATSSDEDTLAIDPLESGMLRVDFNIVGSLESNIDYYNSNVIGQYTQAYIDAMDKIGASVKIKSYEAVQTSTDTGKGSYETATDYTTKVLIDPQTYDFPSIAKEDSVFTQYIARDIRKGFFKPDFFMGRTFILNDGGFIKRTVWTVGYLGNTYEISQIVPRFINNEICFYEANLYVIGPSNDPFRKVTLPSET